MIGIDTHARPSPSGPDAGDFNAIAWGQFQLRGGWRNFWTTTIGYAVLVGGGLTILSRLPGMGPGAVGPLKLMLTALQAGLLLLFACARIGSAVRQDMTSKMIESHRLMPISPAQAVVGYLTGPAAMPLGLAGVNLVLGVWLSASLGTPIALWLTVNGILAGFGAFAAVVAAFGSFVGKPGGVAAVWIGVTSLMANFAAIGAVLPGASLLATPLLGRTVFDLGVVGADAVALYAMPTVFQAWIGGVCFAAACRRYRRDDRPALGWDLGLALLAGWVAVSVFAAVHWDAYRPVMSRGMTTSPTVQFLGSTFSAMLLGLVALAGAAWSAADWAGRRALGDPALGRRPMAPLVVALAASALTLMLVAAVTFTGGSDRPMDSLARTAVALAAFFVAALYVLRVLVRVSTKLFFPMVMWVAFTWLAPLLVDYARWWMSEGESDRVLREPAAFSPVGALIKVWTGAPEGTMPGLVFQCLLAAAAAAAFHATQRRWRDKPPPARA